MGVYSPKERMLLTAGYWFSARSHSCLPWVTYYRIWGRTDYVILTLQPPAILLPYVSRCRAGRSEGRRRAEAYFFWLCPHGRVGRSSSRCSGGGAGGSQLLQPATRHSSLLRVHRAWPLQPTAQGSLTGAPSLLYPSVSPSSPLHSNTPMSN